MSIMEKRKGKRVELYIVSLLRKNGLDAKRIPLSGATDFQKGDVLVFNKLGIPKILEVKARNKGFADIRARLVHKQAVRFVYGRYEYICYAWARFVNILSSEDVTEEVTTEEVEKVKAYKQIANWYSEYIDFLVVKIDRFEPFVVKKIKKGG